jgi:peroxiredoxin
VDTLIVGLQVALATVLAIAAIGKFMDLDGSRQAVQDFGVPDRFAGVLGRALPIAELAIAVLLVLEPSARWGALAALAVFLIFVVAIGYNLLQGRQPDCHCFGQIHSEPAGWPTLFRNGVLAAAATVVVVQGGQSIPGWLDDLSDVGALILVLGAIVIAIGVFQVRLLQQSVSQNKGILESLERIGSVSIASTGNVAGIDPSRIAVPFDIPDVHGNRLILSNLLAQGRPVLLLFTSPSCGPCNSLLPDIGEWTRRFDNVLTIALVSSGSIDDNRAKATLHGIPHVGLQEWPEISKPYGVNATPTGVLVDPDGVIRHPNANGRDEIRGLVSSIVSPRATPIPDIDPDRPLELAPDGSVVESVFGNPGKALGIGSDVPKLPLPTLDGDFMSLADLRGQRVLLLFWNTTCGFCNRMLPDLKEIEAELEGAPIRLVLSSAGTPDELRAQGLRSTIMLDDGLAAISRAFGAPGTPSAVLIDEHGKVASDIMIGADAILDYLDEVVETVPQPI